MGQRQKDRIGIKQETRHNNLRGAWGFSPSIEKEKQDTGEEPSLQSCHASQPGEEPSLQSSQARRKARLTMHPGKKARLTMHPGKKKSQLPPRAKLTMHPGKKSHHAAIPARRAKPTLKPVMQAMPRLAEPCWPCKTGMMSWIAGLAETGWHQSLPCRPDRKRARLTNRPTTELDNRIVNLERKPGQIARPALYV